MSSTAPNDLLFALVDCNNFYASCERVFNPHLVNRPVVVLSNNDGCVIARSKEAKALGIPMGAPAFEYAALFKKHGVAVCSSNYALYGDMSRRVMETLSMFTPDLQVYSIDEAFLLLENNGHASLSRQIRQTVHQWTGIPVSIGIGPTKTLAKAANHCAKKNPAHKGVFALDTPEKEEEILRALPVGEIWGVGRQISAFLNQNGIDTAWDFRSADDSWIREHLTVVGLRMAWELRGTSCLELEEVHPPKKAIMSSKSFGRPVAKWEEAAEALSSYTARAAEKARNQGSLASFIEVFLMTNPHRQEREYYGNKVHIVLPEPTAYTPALIHYAKHGLRSIFREGFAYKKVGILLGGLVPGSCFQPDLFFRPSVPSEKQRALMELIDRTNNAKGRKVLKMAAEGIVQPWKMRQAKRSASFTTKWNEILSIHI